MSATMRLAVAALGLIAPLEAMACKMRIIDPQLEEYLSQRHTVFRGRLEKTEGMDCVGPANYKACGYWRYEITVTAVLKGDLEQGETITAYSPGTNGGFCGGYLLYENWGPWFTVYRGSDGRYTAEQLRYPERDLDALLASGVPSRGGETK